MACREPGATPADGQPAGIPDASRMQACALTSNTAHGFGRDVFSGLQDSAAPAQRRHSSLQQGFSSTRAMTCQQVASTEACRRHQSCWDAICNEPGSQRGSPCEQLSNTTGGTTGSIHAAQGRELRAGSIDAYPPGWRRKRKKLRGAERSDCDETRHQFRSTGSDKEEGHSKEEGPRQSSNSGAALLTQEGVLQCQQESDAVGSSDTGGGLAMHGGDRSVRQAGAVAESKVVSAESEPAGLLGLSLPEAEPPNTDRAHRNNLEVAASLSRSRTGCASER
jgi:hypothetical protein